MAWNDRNGWPKPGELRQGLQLLGSGESKQMNVVSKILTAIARIWSAFWREGTPYFIGVCKGVIATIEGWLYDKKRALYGIAVARILFGSAALGLLLTNFNTRLYTYGSGAAWSGQLEE